MPYKCRLNEHLCLCVHLEHIHRLLQRPVVCLSSLPPLLPPFRVFYSYKDTAIPKGHEAILHSVENKHEANVNAGSRFPTYLTFRRSPHFGHQKAITHLTVMYEVRTRVTWRGTAMGCVVCSTCSERMVLNACMYCIAEYVFTCQKFYACVACVIVHKLGHALFHKVQGHKGCCELCRIV